MSLNHCCARAVFVACESQETEIRKLRAARDAEPTPPILCDADPVLEARLAAALEALGDLLTIIGNEGGYRKAPAQAKLRGARAVFAELGGKP